MTVLRTYQTDLPAEQWPTIQAGLNRWRCKIPKGLLNGGDFVVSPRIGIHNISWIVHEDAVLAVSYEFEARRITVMEFLNRNKSPWFTCSDSKLEPCGSLSWHETQCQFAEWLTELARNPMRIRVPDTLKFHWQQVKPGGASCDGHLCLADRGRSL